MKGISYREERAWLGSGNRVVQFCWKLQGCGEWGVVRDETGNTWWPEQ